MELRALKYFLTVTEYHSISHAAQFLHISQPAISRQMKELESELGVTLFIRGNRRIELTESGLLLKKQAQEIDALVSKTKSAFSDDGDLNGDIYIGAGETNVMKYVTDAIKDFHVYHPKVRFHFYSANADDVKETIDKGIMDFGVLVAPTNTSKYDRLTFPDSNTWGVLVKKNDPLAKLKTVKPDDLMNRPLIISEQKKVQKSLEEWLDFDNVTANFVATYNLLYNATLLVSSDVGVAFALDKIVAKFETSDSLSFVPLQPAINAKVDLIWKKNATFSPAASKFLNCLKKSFKHACDE
ncbi:LysR family transcriptional regulator [Leuconostoc falkenbergense]|uniref:LysR family transcriptional regulator n=1 Tax=Leuconostoc falkenbergense TaxID=2766470 RepID=UPI0024ACCAAC|nr:LysR family transcriptional regulator [Leuconostoc falkenbergense]MDI6666722.1 LysR family transcriptional regulator [Leuconostoc falkenbergense]